MDQQTVPALSPIIPPSSSPQKPKDGSGKLFASLITLAVVLALALGAAGLVLVGTKADKDTQTKQLKSTEKRLAALETADMLAEKQVDSKLYQAVFLSDGNAYFGKITKISKDTIVLEDIYYLKRGGVDKSGNPTPGTDLSLVKLGDELHKPEDKMVIERKNDLFWENLKSDSQVSQAIKQYKQQNPS